MTIDCNPWELERSVWKVEWCYRISMEVPDDRAAKMAGRSDIPYLMPNVQFHNHAVVIDTMTKEQAIDRAWNWCPKDQRPRSKNEMRATKMKMLL